MAMKRYIISLIIKQALSDNEFSIIEKKYLAHAASSLHLSNAEVAAIRKNPDAFTISPPPDESKRMTILYFLLFMMRADGAVKAEEEKLCYQIGFQLGFRQQMIASLISLMRECLDKDVPPDGMLERIKPYLN